MSENITILLSKSTTQEEKINAANNIIINYNLNLTTKEIMSVFLQVLLDTRYCYDYNKYKFLFEYLLSRNIDMFIAISKCCYDKEKTETFWKLGWCVSSNRPFYVGSYSTYNHCPIVKMYKIFLDYNNFDINNLVMPDECKEQIEEYRNEKYGGRLTKAAKK